MTEAQLELVRRLLWERIGSERGLHAAALVWFLNAERLEAYPEATIIDAVGRVAARRPEAETAGVRLDVEWLKRYVETCVIAAYGAGTVPAAVVHSAFIAGLGLTAWTRKDRGVRHPEFFPSGRTQNATLTPVVIRARSRSRSYCTSPRILRLRCSR